MTRKNVQDATLKNVRLLKARCGKLERRADKAERRYDAVKAAVIALAKHLKFKILTVKL